MLIRCGADELGLDDQPLWLVDPEALRGFEIEWERSRFQPVVYLPYRIDPPIRLASRIPLWSDPTDTMEHSL